MAQQIPNKTLFIGDNLPVLRNIDTESIDLIYIDPPFNSNRKYYEPIYKYLFQRAFHLFVATVIESKETDQ